MAPQAEIPTRRPKGKKTDTALREKLGSNLGNAWKPEDPRIRPPEPLGTSSVNAISVQDYVNLVLISQPSIQRAVNYE
jgi:hypothetical protein